MDDEHFLSKLDIGGGLSIESVILDSGYPTIFTCTDRTDRVYFCICCERKSSGITWIITQTSYTTLEDLLTDKITIREAFLAITEEKYLVQYVSESDRTNLKLLRKNQIPSDYLPTKNAYMDAADGEFCEELILYNGNRERLLKKSRRQEKSRIIQERKRRRDNDYKCKRS